ncbi:MAG: hypothetical protein HDR55_03525 [Treponema sp.]|nr:hypothetical protein [Treponema sp.]MBD5406288.1 hypothetical protein [Treponema sp.]MBD5414357.1 hypothetical protein [Treponema sp.]
MTELTWPKSLPLPRISGLSGKKQRAFIRTEMETGPAKQRARFTAVTKEFRGTVILTESERETLDNFYDVSLSLGTLRFTMKNPQTGEINEFRFTDSYEEIGNDGGLWEISLPLEMFA